MKKIHHTIIFDKKKFLREQDHLTRPPRLEGAVKEKMMQPVKKKKKSKLKNEYDHTSSAHWVT